MAVASVTADGITVETAGLNEADLKAALAVETPPEPEPPEPPEPPPDDKTASQAGQTLAGKRRSLQDRIDTITREKYDSQRERDEARARVQALEAELARVKPPVAAPMPPPAPDIPTDRFPRYGEYLQTHPEAQMEDWIDARDTWRDDRKERLAREHAEADARTQYLTERGEKFATSMRTATEADPDLLSKVAPHLLHTKPISALASGEPATFGNFVVEQIMKSDQPAMLLVALSDPALMQRLASLRDPDLVIREIARLESSSGNGHAPSRPVAVPAPVSQAKPPVKPLGSSPQADVDEPPGDAADDAAHLRYWNQKELAARRRRG